MQKTTYNIDNGLNFGKWKDKISTLIYKNSLDVILQNINKNAITADYGGANGILKQYFNNIITIDIDETKKPDIIDNIITHKGNYELIIIRFVLHYLNDYEILQLFENIKSYHKGQILIIQFCNNDLKNKYKNSINEFKYFRNERQLLNLLPECKKIYSKKYKCNKEFYKNRLNIDNAIEHFETLNAYLI